jgi:hypothetical protein
VYFIPDSSLAHSLFGVSPLIRPKGHAVFSNHSCFFFDSPQATSPFLTGSKREDADLWFLQVPSVPKPHHSPSILFTLQELSNARFVAYWHRACGSPSLSTFIDALSSNFIRNIPRLTAAIVRKYPPLSIATSYGHLDTLRQGIASTRKLPSSSALGDSTSRRSSLLEHRRRAFLQDLDDQDTTGFDPPLFSALPSVSRRSARLARSTATDDSQTSTVHHSEWTAADLTGRFPIPSIHGHEYILVTKHLGFIHLQPLKTRTAPSYVSAFRKVFSFFSSNSFPISHIIIDNEISAQLAAFFTSQN